MVSAVDRSEIVFFDVETTIPTRPGQRYALLEFGAILVCPRKLVELDNYSALVRPADLSLISPLSVRCNGITKDAVVSAPNFAQIADRVYDLLHGRVWAGHNILRFDCARIREAFVEINRLPPEPKGTIDSLAVLTQRFGRRAGDMKIAYLEFCFTNIFHGEKRKVDEMMNKIVACLTRLYNHYATIYSSNESVSRVTEVETMVIDEDDLDSQMESQFNSYLEGRFTSGSKSELDKYLGEVEHFAKNQTFEILEYWKNNATKYRVLSQIAKDVLAMPISTVASESAFSTGGRILDPFRSSLAPSMVEALVCTQNWLKSNLPISLRKAMDDVEEFEQYDSGTLEPCSSSIPKSNVDAVIEL